ncbi:MAG: DUF4422 domain-containing protein [Selenomonadaceae bacterium]|nr:DUF4422 domain-containing protein [Selenomonadaceae bacterium]
MKIKIVVALHKAYWLPKDECYFPLQVGALGKEPFGVHRDDEGDNISAKNPNFCELTALYWAWKHIDADYIGLCHYRRYFTRREAFTLDHRKEAVLTGKEWEKILAKHPVVVPKKRRHFIETNRSHYYHAHHREGLDALEEVLKEKYPHYLDAYEKVMGRTWAHLFNMFVMRRDYFERYMEFMFDALFEVEKRVDITGYSVYEARIFGFLAERLLDVWLIAEDVPVAEKNVSFLERQNWIKKGASFLLRKIRGRRD